jgi:hypothetical protein
MLTEKEKTRLENYTKYIKAIADDVHKRNVKVIKNAVDGGVFDRESYDKSVATEKATCSDCDAILKRYTEPEPAATDNDTEEESCPA